MFKKRPEKNGYFTPLYMQVIANKMSILIDVGNWQNLSKKNL